MSEKGKSWKLGKAQRALAIANLGFWIYFWIAFVHSSYPLRSNPLGHPAGSGYTFWGHSIAITESGLAYPFFRVMFYAEFPSFASAILITKTFSPHLLVLNGFFAGVSGGGWLLLGVVVLSFLQWYLVGSMVQKLGQKWFGNSPWN